MAWDCGRSGVSWDGMVVGWDRGAYIGTGS